MTPLQLLNLAANAERDLERILTPNLTVLTCVYCYADYGVYARVFRPDEFGDQRCHVCGN